MKKINEQIRNKNLSKCEIISKKPFECNYCNTYQYGYSNDNSNDNYCSLCGSYYGM